MLGCFIGDIIGSTREGRKSLFDKNGLIYATLKNGVTTPINPPEPILHEGLTFTDDTVLTLATEKALRISATPLAPFANKYVEFFDMHSETNEFYRGPGIGYGMMFMEWAGSRLTDAPFQSGYNSYGNGSAMRIAPLAYHFQKATLMLNTANASASCTHNHPDGIEGAQMVSLALWLARNGETADNIKQIIEDNSEYTLTFDEDKLIKHYYFQPTCKGSVPHALWAALTGPDFETVMRRCLAIGGDTDTIACIAGGLAEILYGVPDDMAKLALTILQRDGPFLFEEYQLALDNNENYVNYIKKDKQKHEVKKDNIVHSLWLKMRSKTGLL